MVVTAGLALHSMHACMRVYMPSALKVSKLGATYNLLGLVLLAQSFPNNGRGAICNSAPFAATMLHAVLVPS